jgi:hypothetical protein
LGYPWLWNRERRGQCSTISILTEHAVHRSYNTTVPQSARVDRWWIFSFTRPSPLLLGTCTRPDDEPGERRSAFCRSHVCARPLTSSKMSISTSDLAWPHSSLSSFPSRTHRATYPTPTDQGQHPSLKNTREGKGPSPRPPGSATRSRRSRTSCSRSGRPSRCPAYRTTRPCTAAGSRSACRSSRSRRGSGRRRPGTGRGG